MKQSIDQKQLEELTKKQLKKLEDWFEPKVEDKYKWGISALELNIGKMIEFLGDKIFSIEFEVDMWFVNFEKDIYNDRELCDALWEAVKQVLKE